MKPLFVGDERYGSPLCESVICSVMNMSPDECQEAVIEQSLILYLEYGREQFTMAELFSSVREDDCIQGVKGRLDPGAESKVLDYVLEHEGRARYRRILRRLERALDKVVSSGHLTPVSNDVLIYEMSTIFRIFPENSSPEAIRAVCQTLMDKCGVWWTGYNVPEGAEFISLTGTGKAVLENNSLEDIVKILAYELEHGSGDENIH